MTAGNRKIMKEGYISWGDLIRVPDPETTLTLFLHVVVHYWRAENSGRYYQTHIFPQDVESVLLRVDHPLYQKIRYHLYEVGGEDMVGVWDETPYHLDFRRDTGGVGFLDHGDYRHSFQLFLRSFLKTIRTYGKYYPSLDRLCGVLAHFPLLQWKCHVCRFYNDWSRKWMGAFLLEKKVSVAPSSLLCLLTYRNKKVSPAPQDHSHSLEGLLGSALDRFFLYFEKIQEQTSADPISILQELIVVLEKYTSVYTVDQVHEFEQPCARDMRHCLYDRFKFLRTKDIPIHHFPRDMMIIRDVFSMMMGIWTASSPSLSDGSPGVLMLLHGMLFQDRALVRDPSAALVVFHPLEDTPPTTRLMTPLEAHALREHHPLLRPSVFTKTP